MTDFRETLSLLEDEKYNGVEWWLEENEDFYFICNPTGKIKYSKISEKLLDVVLDN